jgi:drug/metabolite transporter (DMT)-like permease
VQKPGGQRRDTIDATAATIVIGLTALWGLQQVAVKLGAAGGISPFQQAALRSIGATICIAGWVGLTAGLGELRALFRLGPARLPAAALAILFALEFLFLFPGLQLTTASRGVIFLYTAPFFTAVGTHLLIPAERMGVKQFAGLVTAFAGVGIAFAEGLLRGGGNLTGDLLCLAGGMVWGTTTVIVKASPALRFTPASKLLFLQLAGSAPILLAAQLLNGDALIPTATPTAWAALFYQTVIVAGISYLVWFNLIVRYPAGKLSGFTFLAPLFGILAGHVMLDEPVSAALFLGLTAIAIGLRLVNTRTTPRTPA